MRNRLGVLLGTIILTASVLGGWLGSPANAEVADTDKMKQLLKTFTQVLAAVQDSYVHELSSEELVESAIRGMLRTLDPHSSFFSVRDYERLQEEQQGKYYGLGITIRPAAPGSGRVVVVEPPAHGTPAYRAGLRAGDIIAKIEGESIDDWDVNEEVIPNLKGPKGTTVNITIERLGESEPLEMEVERDEIPVYTIRYAFDLKPGIGYIRVDRFADSTGQELRKALAKLDEDRLDGLILDLRDNPGGAMSQALAVSEQFLKPGETIVSTRNRWGQERPFKAERGGRSDYPIVVLINQASASASEIVSGALQDHDRALIVGQNSFGKALVQTIYPLNGERGLALTTGKYYTPSDRLIQREYGESLWDYYYTSDSQQAASSNRQEFKTDAGRVVYGGGGIKPDYEAEMTKISRFVRDLRRRDLFREFAARLFSDEIQTDKQYRYANVDADSLEQHERQELIDKLTISAQTVRRFGEYVDSKGIVFNAEQLKEDEEILRNLLRQELLLLYFGDDASYKVALELDTQVQKAVELLPEAEELLKRAETAASQGR